MSNRIIPILTSTVVPPPFATSGDSTIPVLDTLHRPLRDLRISVTDRCNFRCVYCMPRAVFDKDYVYLPHQSLLTFEEIARLARLLVGQGVTKIRLTGGEPLLRKNLDRLIGMLRAIDTPSGAPLELTLTTNGALLAQQAGALKAAGLDRVTVSLDALDDAVFRQMNDTRFSVRDVLAGLDAAQNAGLGPVKVNMVVRADMNRDQIVPMARHFKHSPFVLRYIEYMDVGASNGWRVDQVIPSAQVVTMLQESGDDMQLLPVSPVHASDTAKRWRYADGSNEVGFISSVTGAFCGDCTRLRLSTDGSLYTCLFATRGDNLRDLMRSGASDEALGATMAAIWTQRSDRYSALRSEQTRQSGKIEMSYIGG